MIVRILIVFFFYWMFSYFICLCALTGIRDSLRDLVYRVHPLPESITDHVYDFGALPFVIEHQYALGMTRRQLGVWADPNIEVADPRFFARFDANTALSQFSRVFAELMCTAQEFIRTLHGNERSVVSLRDVARCLKVFAWFGQYYRNCDGDRCRWTLREFHTVVDSVPARVAIRQALISALHFCYAARLPRLERLNLWQQIATKWQSPAIIVRCSWLGLEDHMSLNRVVRAQQVQFAENLNRGEGIALNEALLENLFTIFVATQNRIPLFVIGKPGSSKSLAMELLRSNLIGRASHNPTLQRLPAMDIVSYQCSPLSTSDGILAAFQSAETRRSTAPDSCVVVLLDEVGLAEQSPHLPLKVLHKILDEEKGGSVVGISNYSLDPAKMNRAVHLFRPSPTPDDLAETAQGMVHSPLLSGYLRFVSAAYARVYDKQEKRDFWGLRDFYATIKFLDHAQTKDRLPFDGQMYMHAILRNFGGRSQREIEAVLVLFDFLSAVGVRLDSVPRVPVLDLIRANLSSRHSRNLMLLTQNNAALGALFDSRLVTHAKTVVIFGSDFPADKTDLHVCQDLQQIKACMANGSTVVLVCCEALYESLYDVLNQHYIVHSGQRWVRLAFGAHSTLYPVHDDFRIVCVVDKMNAYHRLDPPFLNRFEKQCLERRDVVSVHSLHLQHQIQALAHSLAVGIVRERADGVSHVPEGSPMASSDTIASVSELQELFCGYHRDSLHALAQATLEMHPQADRFNKAVQKLLWVATPEAVFRSLHFGRGKAVQEDFLVDVKQIYFRDQIHTDLVSFCTEFRSRSRLDFNTLGVCIMTYAPYCLRLQELLAPLQANVVLVILLFSKKDFFFLKRFNLLLMYVFRFAIHCTSLHQYAI
jgi:hypothetical protein